ncbi:glycosyltransferase family 4 protein [Peniophora sp. CONT]|nr:glycosyltransferase family 4 protein [Peniophora sp. CONT]
MISDFFHPAIGGVESHIYMLSAQLLALGHKVIVITHSHPPTHIGIRYLHPGVKVYYIPFPPIASNATLPNFFTFLPYLRTIVIREGVDVIHAHASLSSLGHEGILHAHLFGRDGKAVKTVFTDHSLFGFADAASILTNKLLEATLCHVDAVICVSHTGRENTVLRANLMDRVLQPEPSVYVIPNALVADQFKPADVPPPTDIMAATIVVVSRLAYRKGIDLLVAAAPRICAAEPNVRFVIGGDGPKMIDLLQMREKHFLQDRIELLGPVPPQGVRDVLTRGHIFLNTSLTEAFGIAILEAACAGLYVVSTRVGGVPEILPEDMISFANVSEDDVFEATMHALCIVRAGKHDPQRAHERVRGFYNWTGVAKRTERVYEDVMKKEAEGIWDRIERTMALGRFVGPIFTIILIVDCLWFMFLEWRIPREDIEVVEENWDVGTFDDVKREWEDTRLRERFEGAEVVSRKEEEETRGEQEETRDDESG